MPSQVLLPVGILLLASTTSILQLRADDAICPQAHAHNDYLHTRPLLDALDQGFCSVEADVFLVDGELLIGHSRRELSKERTLKALYLDPLRKRIQKNDGKVHAGLSPPFTLLIDFKSDAATTYQALDQLLAEYREIFSYVEDGKHHKQAVTAVVSGNRPFDLIRSDSLRFVGVDGRLSDLAKDSDAVFMPLISDNWNSHFSWQGRGEMPAVEMDKLTAVIAKAHKRNQLVRFWATPDNPAMWSTLQAAGVDLINTDDLKGLSEFLRK